MEFDKLKNNSVSTKLYLIVQPFLKIFNLNKFLIVEYEYEYTKRRSYFLSLYSSIKIVR